MTKVVIKSGVVRKEFILNEFVEKIIYEISEEFNIPPNKVIEMAFNTMERETKNSDEKKMIKLHNELFNLQGEMFKVDHEWHSLHIKNFLIEHELKDLSIVLVGLLNQNRTLRRVLKMEEKYKDIRKLTEHYLFKKIIP